MHFARRIVSPLISFAKLSPDKPGEPSVGFARGFLRLRAFFRREAEDGCPSRGTSAVGRLLCLGPIFSTPGATKTI